MLKSMTGFGRCEIADSDRKVIVEIKSVNHRYCDITVKMPKKLSFFESAIRGLVKKYVQRGKVDVFITYEDFSENRSCIKYNKELAAEYLRIFEQMHADFGIANDICVSGLSRYPDDLTLVDQTMDEEELWHFLEQAIAKACEGLVTTRRAEGESLKKDLIAKLDMMLASVAYIEARSPQILMDYRQKLEEKVKELIGSASLDESRIAMETAIYADKLCIDEEVVRLRSHIEATRSALNDGGAVGRRLDFIAQEMNREANTILSKANDLIISDKAIDLKTEIEKIREQIQNIE